MKCNQETLSAYLDGELDETSQEAVAEHIKTCPTCAEALRQLHGANEILPRHALPHQFHLRLTRKIQAHAGHQRKRRVLILSAAAALLLITGTLFFSRITEEAPTIEAPSPIANDSRTAPIVDDEPAQTATTEDQKLNADEATVAETPVTLASAEAPRYVLRGTFQGAISQATILSIDTGQTGTYEEGTELAPGVRLIAIGKREVTLDINGEATSLRVSNSSAGYTSMTGNWQMIVAVGPEREEELMLNVTEEAGTLTMSLGEETGGLELRGTRQGSRFTLTANNESMPSMHMEGELNAEVSEASATFKQEGDETIMPITLRRITAADVEAADLLESKIAAQHEQVERMGAILVQYAKAHDGKYPNAFLELVPDFAPDLDLFTETGDMGVTYNAGLAYLDVSKAMRDAGYDASIPSEPDDLLNHEAALRSFWKSEIPFFGELLRVGFASTGTIFTVDLVGRADELSAAGLSYDDLSLNPELREAQTNAYNASSQNNMKQLGIVVKMFQSENKYMLTPPGWHTVYPEYVTDAAIFTAPWDEPGTASYQLIFPAAREDDLVALARQLTSNTEALANEGWGSSEVPLVYEVQGNPGLGDGRNVLFLDGHVSYILDTEWNERIQPYLSR